MQLTKRIFFQLSLGLLVVWAYAQITEMVHAKNAPLDYEKPFAVVELFTSEGCSSCPPADQFLNDLTKLSVNQKRNIYTLGFHVDYWNYLGWTDKFSQQKFSQRQRKYAQQFRSSSVYTPQIIVNGKNSASGNQRNKIQKFINEALQIPAQAQIQLTIADETAHEIVVNYKVIATSKFPLLNFALVERNRISHIRRGENAGKTINHGNVVHLLKTIKLDKTKGEVILQKSPDLNHSYSSVIGYLQDDKTMSILAATQIALTAI